MEYYIITVSQSNDILSLILILKCAPPPTEIHFTGRTSTRTHDYRAGYYIIFCRSEGRWSLFGTFLTRETPDARRPIAQSKRVILRFFSKCGNFMDVHVLLICWAFQGWRTHRCAPGIQRYLTDGRQNLKWKYLKSSPRAADYGGRVVNTRNIKRRLQRRCSRRRGSLLALVQRV